MTLTVNILDRDYFEMGAYGSSGHDLLVSEIYVCASSQCNTNRYNVRSARTEHLIAFCTRDLPSMI